MAQGAWITLESVILDYIEESEQTIHKYMKLFNLAFRGMDSLGVDFFYEVRTYKLPINSNGTVTIPGNVLNWVKVGLLDWNGGIFPLSYNDTLSNYAEMNPNRKTSVSSNIDGLDTIYSLSSPCFYNYWDGASFGCINGNGWIGGTFKVDMNKNVIILDNWNNCNFIVLEALISPSENEDYYIPLVFREALIEWLGWRDIKHIPSSRRGNLGDKRDRQHDYYNARRIAISKWKPFNLEQAAMV